MVTVQLSFANRQNVDYVSPQKKWRCKGDRIARAFDTDPTEPIGSQRVTMCRAAVIAILFPSDHRTPIHFIGFHEHNLRIGFHAKSPITAEARDSNRICAAQRTPRERDASTSRFNRCECHVERWIFHGYALPGASFTSLAARNPDCSAPCIQCIQAEVWSPAKCTRPSGVATCGHNVVI